MRGHVRRVRRAVATVVVTAVVLTGAGTPVHAQLAEVIAHIPGLGNLFGGLSSALSGLLQQQVSLTDVIEDSYTGGYDISLGNVGRQTEVSNALWWMQRDGSGLASSDDPNRPGMFNQRIPGVTDEAGWLNVLAAPRLGDPASATVLLGGRPATETTAAAPSAFRTWPIPTGPAWSNPGITAAREALDILGDVAEGTATWRSVWDDIEYALPPSVTEGDLRALGMAASVADRIVEGWRRREQQAATELQHTHAAAEAASTLTAQVGETAAHLGTLRDDDLMREQRVDQAVLANATTQTELLLAVAQGIAQEQSRTVRARYEAERARREREARWLADATRAQTEMEAFATQSRGLAARRTDSFQNALLAATGL